MAFDPLKFKFLKKLRDADEKYGENAQLIVNSATYKKPDKKKRQKHSFDHLLNKVFKVPQYEYKRFDPLGRPPTVVADPEFIKAHKLIQNGAHEKTHFDD